MGLWATVEYLLDKGLTLFGMPTPAGFNSNIHAAKKLASSFNSADPELPQTLTYVMNRSPWRSARGTA